MDTLDYQQPLSLPYNYGTSVVVPTVHFSFDEAA